MLMLYILICSSAQLENVILMLMQYESAVDFVHWQFKKAYSNKTLTTINNVEKKRERQHCFVQFHYEWKVRIKKQIFESFCSAAQFNVYNTTLIILKQANYSL